MPTQIRDLWPQNIPVEDVVSPLGVLREQASLLGGKTSQLVTAEVRTRNNSGTFVHVFVLVCQVLDAYNYELFEIQHRITFYPMQAIYDNKVYQIETQDGLVRFLQEALSSQKTIQIIQSLVAQAKGT